MDNSTTRSSNLPRSEIAYLKDVASVFRLVPAAALGSEVAWLLDVGYPPKRFVYIIQSLNHSEKRYIGVTSDVVARLSAHNAGQNRSTARWKPWGIDVTIEFRTERMAVRFEKYLKSGAGHAFRESPFR